MCIYACVPRNPFLWHLDQLVSQPATVTCLHRIRICIAGVYAFKDGCICHTLHSWEVNILDKSTGGKDFLRYRLRETAEVPRDGACVPCFSLGWAFVEVMGCLGWWDEQERQDMDMLAVIEHECRKGEQCLCSCDSAFCICRNLQATQVKREARKGGGTCKR
jgi:hypothetical protein